MSYEACIPLGICNVRLFPGEEDWRGGGRKTEGDGGFGGSQLPLLLEEKYKVTLILVINMNYLYLGQVQNRICIHIIKYLS